MIPRYGHGLGSTFLADVLSRHQHDALRDKRARLLDHPLWQGLSDGRTSLGQLRTFAVQDAWLIREIHRLDGLAIAKAPDPASADYLIAKLTPKQGALASVQAFGLAIGLEPDQLVDPVPLAGCAALTTQFYYHLVRSSFAEAIACIGASETIFLEICGRIEQPLRDHYGLSDDDIRFFSAHDALEPAERRMNELIGRLVADSPDPDTARAAVFAAVSLCYDAEQLFYDTVWQCPDAHRTAALGAYG
ncbi:MAG: hypothetical protein U5L04_00130 [Trueperaceae bacterium]|nr:hypothetical protein [Trueperaceae bacterium]